MPHTTGNRYVAQFLQAYGIDSIFQVPTAFFGVMAEMENMNIRRVVTHGEKAAAYMADGYARARKGPGVCMAQSIGAANLAAGLADAFMAQSPVIAMTNAIPAEHRYRHVYQEYDHAAPFHSVTKASYNVDKVSRIPDSLRQTFRDATTGSPGPVHLHVRDEALYADADLDLVIEDRHKRYPAFRPEPTLDHVKEAARLISEARRPVIISGSGVMASGAWNEVAQLAEMLTIPVATTLNGKMTLAADHPLNVGVVGRYSHWCANRIVSAADLVIAVGTRLGGMATWEWRVPPAGTPTVQIGIDPSELGRNYPAAAAVQGDAKVSLQRLINVLEPVSPRQDVLDEVTKIVGEWRSEFQPLIDSDASPMRPERIVKEIAENLPDDAMVVSDTGHSGIWSGVMMPLTRPGHNYLRCVGSLGWGLPGAIGAKLALPDRPVLCFTGDGGFWYHIGELETARRHNVNLVVAVNDNRSLNQEKGPIDNAYGGNATQRAYDDLMMFSDLDLAKIADAMGCYSERVERPADIPAALNRAFAANKPALLDLVSDITAMAPQARPQDLFPLS